MSESDRHSVACDVIAALSKLPPSAPAVLWRSVQGQTVGAISARLRLSPTTVKRHRRRAVRALGVRTIPEAGWVLGRAGIEIPADWTRLVDPDRRAA